MPAKINAQLISSLEMYKCSSLWDNCYYLQVLLAMKHNGLGFDFTVFDVHLVTAEDNGNVLTDTDKITMPVGHVLIGNSRGDVEHDDGTLSCEGIK